MATQQDIALNTPELLHEILLCLPPRDLLTSAQLVCRNWHNTIVTSTPLQQALFFSPCLTNLASVCSQPRLNPILVEDFPIFFDDKLHDYEDFSELPIARLLQNQESRLDRFMRKEASWRCMLVQQPPLVTMGYWFSEQLSEWRPSSGARNNVKDGKKLQAATEILQEAPSHFTMGILYDEAVAVAQKRGSQFRIFWDMAKVLDRYWVGGDFDDDDEFGPSRHFQRHRLRDERVKRWSEVGGEVMEELEEEEKPISEALGSINTAFLHYHFTGCAPWVPAVRRNADTAVRLDAAEKSQIAFKNRFTFPSSRGYSIIYHHEDE